MVKIVRKEPETPEAGEPEDTQASEPEDTQAGELEDTQADKPYKWYEMGFFTRWDHGGRCRVLCIDTPKQLQLGLKKTLLREQLNFGDPFAMHVPLIDRIILLCDLSVWRVRHPVRKIEKVSIYACSCCQESVSS